MNATGHVVASLVTLLFMAGVGQAATCADRNLVVSKLQSMFGESLIANALSPRDAAVLEIYAAEDAKTWSIVVALPKRNLACLAATGKGREDLEAAMHIPHVTQLAQR